jgi:hypothetical protein
MEQAGEPLYFAADPQLCAALGSIRLAFAFVKHIDAEVVAINADERTTKTIRGNDQVNDQDPRALRSRCLVLCLSAQRPWKWRRSY